MYAGVPMAMPALVKPELGMEAEMAFATPKSVTRACEPISRTLPGLMSRWMTPSPCA